MTSPISPEKPENPAVQELRAIRGELLNLKTEIREFRVLVESRKPPDIKDQVAKGVILAGLFWFVIISVFQILSIF